MAEKASGRCHRCPRPLVYFRPYSGEALCSKCFEESIIKKVKRTIARYSLLEPHDRVAVAVSGGKDSLALLKVLHRICGKHPTKLYAVTVDEGIAGYRDEALSYAKQVSEELGIKWHSTSYKELYGFDLDEALRSRGDLKITSCSFCGVLRRRALDLAAKALGCNVIATAHNLDDTIQTYLINLITGDLGRMRWLDPSYRPRNEWGLRRIKPFIELYEQEVAFLSYLLGNPFQTTTCPYMEEGIRSEIRLMLNELERRHPGVKYNLFRSVMKMVRSLREGAVEEKGVRRCSRCGAISSGELCQVCNMLELLSPRLKPLGGA